jgi:tetratricopeptide (TPR) repeat protein
MEVMGMKRKIRPWDENLIAEFYNEELEAARGLEESGEIFRAVSDYEATVSTFDHWQDMSNVAAKAQQLKQSQDYRQFLKKEKRRSRRESSKLNKFSEVYSQIERSSLSLMDLRKILSKTGIQSLIKEVRTGKNINDRRVAIRLLQSLTINSQSQGWKNLKKKEYRKAIFFYEIASRASKLRDYGRRGFIFYNLACAYALDKNKHQALENLELAVENGFDELAILERDEDLDSIRNTSEFRGIIQKLKH